MKTVDLDELLSIVKENLDETIKKYTGQVILHDLPIIQSNSSLLFTIL